MEEYTALTEDIYQQFSECSTFVQEYEHLVGSKGLAVPFVEENPRSKIIAEYFYKLLNYCKSNKFSFVQANVCCRLFEIIIKFAQQESNFGPEIKIACTELFKQKLIELNRPPDSPSDIFSPHEVKVVSSYFLKSILVQLTAFQYVLQRPVIEHVYETTVVIQTPIAAPSLSTAEESS